MSRYSIKVGETIEINQQRFEIVNVVGRKTQARDLDSGELQEWPTNDLLSLFENGQLQFTDLLSQAGEATADSKDKSVLLKRTLEDFPERVRRMALRKWKYLGAICPQGRIFMSRISLASTLKSLAPEVEGGPDRQPPSVRTFYRWHRAWVNAKMDVRALIDRWELRGRKPSMNYPQRLVVIITDGIEKFYLTNQRQTKQELLGLIQHEVALANRTLPRDEALPKVNIRTVNKFLGQYDRYEILKARYGERYARQSVRTFGAGQKVERPMQRVEVDHTPLDILVIDIRTQLILGRPWITVMIDYYSRMVVGLHIGFRRPNADSVLRCLRHAISPKTYVAERFPDIEGDWPCYGLIEELWCDNGLEFHGHDLEAAAAGVGTHIMYCPSREPNHKGVMERFNGTMNRGLLHSLPGTTFAQYDQRFQYNSEGKAVLPLPVLEEIVHRWLIDVYACSFHRGIQTAPLDKWTEGIQKAPPKLPSAMMDLKIVLGQIERRHLNKNGIQANDLHYNSDALQDMRRRYGDIDVTVRIAPDDLGAVNVLDEQRQDYVLAQCTIPDYAQGLSIEQHRLIRKKAKADYANTPYPARLLSAKAAIREMTKAILVKHGETANTNKKGRPKLDRAARDLLQVMPEHEFTDAPDMTNATTSDNLFTDDDWFTDVPDFIVEDRSYQRPNLM